MEARRSGLWAPVFFFFLPLSQSLFGWTEHADLITKFSGIDRFEKEINFKNRGRRSCMLSGLLKKAGMASRNIVMKKQYPFSFALDFFLERYGAPLRALRGRGRFAKKKEIRQL